MKRFFVAIGMWLVRLTWGILDTLVGFICFIALLPWTKKVGIVANTIVIELKLQNSAGGWGFSSGGFIFSNSPTIWDRDQFLYHEWGHSWPQIVAMGPLHPFLVSIPSAIRFWYRSKTKKWLAPYDAVWFEGTATRWGTRWFKWGAKHGLWK